jgi:hypothetical protein
MVNALSFLTPGWHEQGGVLFQPRLPNMQHEQRKSLDLKVHVDRFLHPKGGHSFAVGVYREDDTACEFALSSNAASSLLSTSNPSADYHGRVEVAQGRFQFVHLNQKEHFTMLKMLQSWF